MLNIDSISYSYGQQLALDKVSFECAEGAITCLIGPSGCGKTTALRLIAGLIQPQAGSIALDGSDLANAEQMTAPENRPVGLVFQEGALFPHMSVADNVAFGLTSGESESRVQELLQQVGLEDFADRFPDSLSGGQRQRVALARAIAPRPKVLLFDEPYANIDVQRRRSLRDDARRMIREHNMIGVFVTHDPDEVMALADHVVVLNQGRVEQQGNPQSLYDNPATRRVAELFGDSESFAATLTAEGLQTPFGLWSRNCLRDSSAADGSVAAVVRPDHLSIVSAENGLVVDEVRAIGNAHDVILRSEVDSAQIRVRLVRDGQAGLRVGDRVRVEPSASSVFTTPA